MFVCKNLGLWIYFTFYWIHSHCIVENRDWYDGGSPCQKCLSHWSTRPVVVVVVVFFFLLQAKVICKKGWFFWCSPTKRIFILYAIYEKGMFVWRRFQMEKEKSTQDGRTFWLTNTCLEITKQHSLSSGLHPTRSFVEEPCGSSVEFESAVETVVKSEMRYWVAW